MADPTNPGAPADPLAAVRAEIAYGPIGWATHHEPPMLFPIREEAALHCGDGEEPISLVPVESLTALLAQLEAAQRAKADGPTLLEVERHLRDEADFNRSWADGRRAAESPTSPEYIARRLELAEERERWADAIGRARDAITGAAHG